MILYVQMFCYQNADRAPAPAGVFAITCAVLDLRPGRVLLSIRDLVPQLANEKCYQVPSAPLACWLAPAWATSHPTLYQLDRIGKCMRIGEGLSNKAGEGAKHKSQKGKSPVINRALQVPLGG